MKEISKINLESEEIKKVLENLKEAAKIAAEEMSPNYRQKIVYSLLNALKAENQKEFLWIILRSINNPKIRAFNELARKIRDVYSLPAQSFEKWGYSVVLGIMSAEKGGD